MADRDPLPNDSQRRALGELLHDAFILMRYASEEESHALAYALHNIPVEIYGWGTWDVCVTRGMLKRFQAKHYNSEYTGPDFVAKFDAIFPPDRSSASRLTAWKRLGPKRHWFAFSLRKLFVIVAAICLWLGYYVHWKNERQEARAWIDCHVIGGSIGFHPEPRPALPWMLKMLWDEPVELILMQHEPAASFGRPVPAEYHWLVGRVRELFPEAQVVDLSANR